MPTPPDPTHGLAAATDIAIAAGRAVDDDLGASNHDAVLAQPPAGVEIESVHIPSALWAVADGAYQVALVPRSVGQAHQRTVACETLAEELRRAGWAASVWYTAD